MSSANGPTPDELRVLIKATGGEIENMTDKLADEVALVDEDCAAKIRAIGAEAGSALREAALDIEGSPTH
jgi:hypothetical protein